MFTLLNGPSLTLSLTVARIVSADSHLFRYIQTGECDRIQQLLVSGQASPANMAESSYGTLDALLFALNCSQLEVCQLLISWGADPHKENETTLTRSAADMAWNFSHECPSPEISQRRIEDVFPAPLDLEHRGFSPLHKIVIGLSYADLGIVLSNTPKAELDAVDCHGRSATHWAAWKGDAEVLTRILGAGADPDLGDSGSRAAVHFSCMTHSAACTRVLVEAGANANKADDYGETPLHCACASGRLANVEYLLSVGVNANAGNAKGVTPLMSAS
jgi:ankyrin repeat protein